MSQQHDGEAMGESSINFATFVESLAQQTIMHLGVIPHPETGQSDVQLVMAKQSIDILEMLCDKSKGNLDQGEEKLISAVLHDLRLLYVQKSQG